MKQSDFSKVQEKVCLVVDCKQQYHRTEGNRVGLRGGAFEPEDNNLLRFRPIRCCKTAKRN